MVTKTQARRKQDIKSKLMAAIAMLLVSSIMMVSSTYAWFTLSTAPEVTGISTAVGANGNLEIALLPKTGGVGAITTNVGDSVLDIERKNVTWGNLVDLSDTAIYGLDSITLYPAALDRTAFDTDGTLKTIGPGFLKTPTYGSDGRVAELVANTSTGYYDATEGDFYPNTDMGVRAIGTASGMTSRQLAYRNARAAASTAMAQAKSVASNSLNNNGSTLANVAIKKGTGQTEFDLADLNALKAIVDDLLGTDSKTGALQHIEKAYMQYIIAYSASAQINDVEKDENVQAYKFVEGLVEAPGATIDSVISGLSTLGEGVSSVSLPQAIYTGSTENPGAVDKLLATKATVTTAKTTLEGLIAQNKASYTWNEISDVLYKLANPDEMQVNGIKAGEIMQGDNMSKLVNSVAGNGLKVSMASGGGVYVDIADHCGDYNASVVIEEVSYNGLKLTNMTARMETKSTVNPAYLSSIGTAIENAGAPASGNTADQPITDMFGYVIDLAFKTNAAESNLLLQQEAVDRIYADNANAGTMGHGSNMTFSTVSAGLSDAQIKELISAIRMVFFTVGNDGNEVVMNAKLDGANATKTNGEWKANIVLYTEKQGMSYTKVDTTVVTAPVPGTAYYTKSGDVYTQVTGLIAWAADTEYYTGTTNADVVTEEPKTDNIIMPLTQNQPHQLSVLVYLDGNNVGNEDVAAAAATSLVGQLNLQFASSATLVPMDYAQLHTPNTTGTTTYDVTVDGTKQAVKAAQNTAYSYTMADGVTLASISVGGTTLTAEDYTQSGQEITIKAEKVTGAIVIDTSAEDAPSTT